MVQKSKGPVRALFIWAVPEENKDMVAYPQHRKAVNPIPLGVGAVN